MKIVSRSALFVRSLLISFCAIGLVSAALQAQESRPASQQPPALRFTVAPAALSPIEIKTLPDALCTLHSAETRKDRAHAMTIFADSEGNARFFAHPTQESEKLVRIVIECEAGGKTLTHNIEFRANSVATREMPAPTVTKRRAPEDALIRPALTEAEASRFSDADLVKRHYPLPPDRKVSPAAYRQWVKAVSVPVTVITPKVKLNPNVAIITGLKLAAPPNSPYKSETMNNWSGMELPGALGPLAWLQGSWIVPSVNSESGFDPYTASSTWIGIDGDGTDDLVQCGTEQQAYRYFWIQFTSYYAWSSFYPQSDNESVVSNMTVNPGDQMFTQAWIADGDGNPNLAGGSAHFYFEDTNSSGSGVVTEVVVPVGSTAVSGKEVEWIEERPSPCGDGSCSPYDLANYGTVSIIAAVARISNATGLRSVVNCCGTGSIIITMINGTTTLSSVTPLDQTDMKFTWHAFH